MPDFLLAVNAACAAIQAGDIDEAEIQHTTEHDDTGSITLTVTIRRHTLPTQLNATLEEATDD